jgi:2-keto-4-pentenoate hydratase/2-oxohepta-3-ene-1,7-dioic acid hydratase in catechol pathway
MRLYIFELDRHLRLGAEHNGRLIDLGAAHAALRRAQGGDTTAALPTEMLAFIQAGAAALTAASSALAYAVERSEGLVYDFEQVRLRAPISRPGKILCSGVNYPGHKQENPSAVLPETPGFFVKLPSAIVGPGDPIVLPKMSAQVDYEVEVAAVLGMRLRRASEAAAQAAVFGYTILHDVSARDIQMKAPQPNQISLGKNFDTFAPIGPCIVTADELPRPDNLWLRTILNGQVVQDGSTSEWLFALPYMLAFLSNIMTLDPGDIVTTGTPAGVGYFRQPQLFLKPGDVVALEVEGIGRLENPVISESEH